MLVYDDVIRYDLDYEAVTRYGDGWDRESGFSVVMYRRPNTTLILPWVNLLLTCKSINAELGAYMSSPVVLRDEHNRTYSMDIRGSISGVLKSLTWHKIPCSPSNVNTVLVNILFEPKLNYSNWDNGGPMPIVRQLYQTLNLLLHNGPILSRSRPLQHPLKLKKLEVHTAFKLDSNSDEPSAGSTTTGIVYLLERLQSVGLLHGYIDHAHISDEHGHTELKIEAVEDPGVPYGWDRYGFDWGRDHKNPVQWEIVAEEPAAESSEGA